MSNQHNQSHRPGDGSTGPISPAGKDISSRNGLVHGARSEKHVILPNESEDKFKELHEQWLAEYKPQTKLESQMVELVAKRHWHFQRCERLYDEAQEKLLGRNPDLDSWTEQDHRTVQLATRYRNAAERSYKSARADLDTLRKNRIDEGLREEKYKAAYYANCKIRLSGEHPDPPLIVGPDEVFDALKAGTLDEFDENLKNGLRTKSPVERPNERNDQHD